MTDQGGEIPRDSWEYRLVAAVVRAVERRTRQAAGGRGTRWNDRVVEETDPEALGSAHDDGTLSISVEGVVRPLLKARDLDRPLTADEAWQIRDAMDTLTHEAAHLMAPAGDPSASEAYPYDDAASVFDEGRVEHWTKQNLDVIINDVFADAGLDHVTAEVLRAEDIDAYPTYTAAVRDIDSALARRSGLSSAEVTQKLMCADDSQRWNVAVDMVIDKQLVETGLMPEEHRAVVRQQLVAPLRQTMDGLVAIEGDDSLEPQEKAQRGAQYAQIAIAGFDTELNRIQNHYQAAIAQQAQNTQQAQNAQQAQNTQTQNTQTQSNQENAQGNELPPDLKRLRAVTGGVAPAHGAVTGMSGAVDQAATRPQSKGRGHQQGDRGLSGP